MLRGLAAIALLLATGCAATSEPAVEGALGVPAGAQEAVVVRHTDGDTLWLRGIGTGPVPRDVTKVRVLEIDTPEVLPRAECFGKEASGRTASLLPIGAHVRVQNDRELHDRYGRLLLYVWTADGISLEEVLLRGGYARSLLVRPNDRYIDRFRAVEDEARQARRGLWGAC
ncbi:MAG: micrococcal nuclease [Actinomycetota bacterium]|nr:micrococcal nuclease [Actinomycetota bacterium]